MHVGSILPPRAGVNRWLGRVPIRALKDGDPSSTRDLTHHLCADKSTVGWPEPHTVRSTQIGERTSHDDIAQRVADDPIIGSVRSASAIEAYSFGKGLKVALHGLFSLQGTAAAGGIVFQNPTVSANNYLSLGISHEVGNPFCTFGAIRYSVPVVKIWKNGTMSISGSRQPVPHHEAYGLFTNSNGTQAWATMYRGSNGGFGCVSGLCVSDNISKTHTPN